LFHLEKHRAKIFHLQLLKTTERKRIRKQNKNSNKNKWFDHVDPKNVD
jgi:hypothetical protein